MNETQDDKGRQDDPGKDSRARKLARFAKKHPETTLIAAVGASAFLAGEFAFGALLGVGAALLVTSKTGADLRGKLRESSRKVRERINGRKVRELLASPKGWARRALAQRPAHSDRATEPPV
jgi:hypothetical protein